MYQGRVRLTVSSKCIECVSICIEPLTSSYPPQAYPERYICIVSVSTMYRCCIDTIETSLAVLSEHNDTHSIHVRYELGVLTPPVWWPCVSQPNCIETVSFLYRASTGTPYRCCIGGWYRVCIEHVSITYYDTVS